jgi:hypothetical protein
MTIITTRYISATTTRGSRIAVSAYGTKTRLYFPYQHDLDSFENHVAAAKAYVKYAKLNRSTGVHEGEYAVASSKRGYTFILIGETEYLGAE